MPPHVNTRRKGVPQVNSSRRGHIFIWQTFPTSSMCPGIKHSTLCITWYEEYRIACYPITNCRSLHHWVYPTGECQLLITAHCAFLFQNNICKHWLGHIASHVTQDRTVVSFITGFTQLVNSSFSIPHTAPLYFETRFAYNDLALFHV